MNRLPIVGLTVVAMSALLWVGFGCKPPEIEGVAGSKADAPDGGGKSPPAVGVEVRDFFLPEDLPAAREVLALEIKSVDLYATHFRASNVREPVRLHFRPGTRIVVEGGKMPPFLIWKSAVIALSPGKPANFEVKSVSGSQQFAKSTAYNVVSGSLLDSSKYRFELEAPDANSAAARFVERAEIEQDSWVVTQAGVWIIQDDLTLGQLSQYEVQESHRGGEVSISLHGAKTVRRVREILEQMGDDPLRYKIFLAEKEASEKKQKRMKELLVEADFYHPGPRYYNAIVELGQHDGQEEAVDLLLKYAKEHPDAGVRDAAFDALARTGLAEDSGILLIKATEDPDPDIRFLAAQTLFEREDPRGYPLLAACLDDPRYKKYKHVGKLMARFPRDGSEKMPSGKETILAYWERVYGWEALAAKAGDITAIRQTVQTHVPAMEEIRPARPAKPAQ